jgi:hypothetical protein
MECDPPCSVLQQHLVDAARLEEHVRNHDARIQDFQGEMRSSLELLQNQIMSVSSRLNQLLAAVLVLGVFFGGWMIDVPKILENAVTEAVAAVHSTDKDMQ